MKEFWVKGHFCRDLRVICPKSASSSNRLYPGGQWINVPWNTGSRRSLHTTVISRRQGSRPITPPGFTAFWLESIKCWWGEALGQSPLAEFWQRQLVKRQTIHTRRAITCLLAVFCWLLHVQYEEHQSNWQPREKRPRWWFAVFLVFLFFFFSLPCGLTWTTMLSVR